MTSTPATATTVPARPLLAVAILIPFLAFSLWVAVTHGLFGFLTLARDEPWGLQVLLDLLIACSFGLTWVAQDARKRGITAWPYFIATFLLGSIGLLAYAIRRGLPTR
ncbi:MAG: hypothetical protein ABI867_20685 [Kofleriaceae bacterium]